MERHRCGVLFLCRREDWTSRSVVKQLRHHFQRITCAYKLRSTSAKPGSVMVFAEFDRQVFPGVGVEATPAADAVDAYQPDGEHFLA